MAAVLAAFLGTHCWSLVSTSDSGSWPAEWPSGLDPLRNASRTIEVATGIQQTIHEIPVPDRETFEDLWPRILDLRSKGGVVVLYRVGSAPPADWGSLLSNEKPAVRIYTPTGGHVGGSESQSVESLADAEAQVKKGKMLRAGPPWPADVQTTSGELPEYVTSVEDENGRLKWVVAADRNEARGFLHRARVDIDLVVDASVIDLNRIRLPGDGAIVDRRWGELPPG